MMLLTHCTDEETEAQKEGLGRGHTVAGIGAQSWASFTSFSPFGEAGPVPREVEPPVQGCGESRGQEATRTHWVNPRGSEVPEGGLEGNGGAGVRILNGPQEALP